MLQISDMIVQNENKFMEICTVLILYVLKYGRITLECCVHPRSSSNSTCFMDLFYVNDAKAEE